MTLFPLVQINYLYFSVSSATLDTYVPMILLLSFQCLLVCFTLNLLPKCFLKLSTLLFWFLLGLGIFWLFGFVFFKTFTVSLEFEFAAPSVAKYAP